MKLLAELTSEEIELLKETNIVICDKEYTSDECRIMLNKVLDYVMSFSQDEIIFVEMRYKSIIDKLYSYE